MFSGTSRVRNVRQWACLSCAPPRRRRRSSTRPPAQSGSEWLTLPGTRRMAREGEMEKKKKGRWSFQSLFKPSLHHKSFRNPRAGVRPVLPPRVAANGVHTPGQGSPPTPPSLAPGKQPSSDAGEGPVAGTTPQPGSATAAAAAHPLAGRSLVVQMLGARRLRAADSNGLSDPYVVVKVG